MTATMSGPATSSPGRSLLEVIARRAHRHGSRRALTSSLWRAVGLTLLATLLAAPFAVLWGVGHPSIHDYLGPHRVTFASNYDGEIEIEIDLGPIGNA